MSYLGNPPVVQATRTLSEFVATAGQTTFTPPGGYQVGYVDVVVNGSMLQQTDFTATDGSTVVLGVACSLNDDVRIIALGTFQVANATPADGSVTTAKLAANAVTQAKLDTLVVPLGIGQTWTNVTASRALGTTYTNTTGRPIEILIAWQSNVQYTLLNFTLNGSLFAVSRNPNPNGTNWYYALSVVIPNGVTYMASGGNALQEWFELR